MDKVEIEPSRCALSQCPSNSLPVFLFSLSRLAASVKACSSQGNVSARFKSYKQHSCPSPLASYHNKLLASYFHLPLLLFAPPPRLSPPDPPLMSKSSLRVAHSPGALFKPSVLSHN